MDYSFRENDIWVPKFSLSCNFYPDISFDIDGHKHLSLEIIKLTYFDQFQKGKLAT